MNSLPLFKHCNELKHIYKTQIPGERVDSASFPSTKPLISGMFYASSRTTPELIDGDFSGYFGVYKRSLFNKKDLNLSSATDLYSSIM